MEAVVIEGVRYYYCPDCEPDFLEEIDGEAEEES